MITIFAFAQEKLNLVSGNFNFLKDTEVVNLVFNFENVRFMNEDFTEMQYLERRRKEVVENPKKGLEEWKEWSGKWEYYKNEVYLETFIKNFNKYSKKLKLQKNTNSKYTLLIEPKWINPGWYAFMIMNPSIISVNMKFVETNDFSNVALEIEANKIMGDNASNEKENLMEYNRI